MLFTVIGTTALAVVLTLTCTYVYVQAESSSLPQFYYKGTFNVAIVTGFIFVAVAWIVYGGNIQQALVTIVPAVPFVVAVLLRQLLDEKYGFSNQDVLSPSIDGENHETL